MEKKDEKKKGYFSGGGGRGKGARIVPKGIGEGVRIEIPQITALGATFRRRDIPGASISSRGELLSFTAVTLKKEIAESGYFTVTPNKEAFIQRFSDVKALRQGRRDLTGEIHPSSSAVTTLFPPDIRKRCFAAASGTGSSFPSQRRKKSRVGSSAKRAGDDGSAEGEDDEVPLAEEDGLNRIKALKDDDDEEDEEDDEQTETDEEEDDADPDDDDDYAQEHRDDDEDGADNAFGNDDDEPAM